MNPNTTHYLRCPYCGRPGEHSKKVSKSVGLFRVKELYNNILLMECKKCGKVCRLEKTDEIREWSNMTVEEKKVFQQKAWVNYNLNKTGGNNGKKI